MRRYRIGLILGTKDTDYPRAIRLGMQNTLEGMGHVLVCIADMIPYHTHARPEQYLRVVFELVSRLDLDVTIVPAGTVNGYLEGNEGLAREMYTAIDPRRILLLERNLPNRRCIIKDGKPGMRECMVHLIEDCGLTRIGFVSGPASSVGARERESIYFQEMGRHHLPINAGMFVRGKFSGECPEVFERMIDTVEGLQAIVCSTDLLAFTAYRVMRKRGLAVGKDIAITGFDDHPSAAHIDPPLSTIHMTGYDYGCMAAREAIRLCEGKPQEEFVLSSRFIARGSCGEDWRNGVEHCISLLEDPFEHRRALADMVVESSLSMAGPQMTAEYREIVDCLIDRIAAAYHRHQVDPRPDDTLFSTRDFELLFDEHFEGHLSLEGFHAQAIEILEALINVSIHNKAWLMEQISVLHLHIARLQSMTIEQDSIERDRREYMTFGLAEDALLQQSETAKVYKRILFDLSQLGIRDADLFLLPDPMLVSPSTSLSLSDTVRLAATMRGGISCVAEGSDNVSLQELLSTVLPHYHKTEVLTLGTVMAGLELMGILVMDAGMLADNRQLMAMLNIGLSLKHIQMIESEREMNELLSNNNLLLERQSQHDEMTGLLNRRGLTDGMQHALSHSDGSDSALMFCDLDGMKFINDSYGHDMGDVALKACADILKGALPEKCLIARRGGDEYVCFIPDTTQDEADRLVEAVLATVERFNKETALPFSLSMSCGCDVLGNENDVQERIENSIKRADKKMYAMKKQHHASRRGSC